MAVKFDAILGKLREEDGGAPAWGDITGTLASQTDLQTALDAKVDLAGDTMSGDLTISKTGASLYFTDTAKTWQILTSNSGANLQIKSPNGADLWRLDNNADTSEIINGILKPKYNGAIPLRVRGESGQTANLQEWQDSSGTVLASIDASGNLSATNLSNYQLTSEKGAANGYASLGSDGKVPTSQLNPLAITSTSVVANEAAQLALTAQEGDVAVRSDLNKSYIHNGGTAGTMADWTELLTPTDAVLSVNGQTGTVSLTTANIADSADKRYVTDAQLTVLGNTSGTNTGDQDLSGYALLAGRTGGQTLYGGDAANDDLTLHGTSSATRTSSYVLIQPTAGSVGVGTGANAPSGLTVSSTVSETALGYDNFRFGIASGTPRIIIEDAGYDQWQMDNALGVFRIFKPGVEYFKIDDDGPHSISATGGIYRLKRNDTTVTAGDIIGRLVFEANDASTTTNPYVAEIRAIATNTISSDINPGVLAFYTTPSSAAGALTERMRITQAGGVGIGTSAPQGILHAVEGAGSFMTTVKSSVVGTAQTIIPDAAGDVTRMLVIIGGLLGHSTALNDITALNPTMTITPGNSIVVSPDGGTNQYTLAVSAGGAFTIQRTAGSNSGGFCVLWLAWL